LLQGFFFSLKMETYIALLRGINVGGHRKILMKDLKDLLNSIGLKNCITYIQSGNIVFNTIESNTDDIASMISTEIEKHFSFDVPTIVVTLNELVEISQENIFARKETKQLYYTFLSTPPTKEDADKFSELKFDNTQFELKKKGIYLNFDTKVSDSKLSNNLIEKKLKVSATTRNWKTIQKLLTIAKDFI